MIGKGGGGGGGGGWDTGPGSSKAVFFFLIFVSLFWQRFYITSQLLHLLTNIAVILILSKFAANKPNVC